jgi:VWFA-related protein
MKRLAEGVVMAVMLLVLFVLVLYRHPLFSQVAPTSTASTERSTAPPLFKSRSDLVLVPVVVLKHGEHVTGLTKSSFRLEQNGVEQTVASVEEIKAQGAAASELAPADGSYSNLPLDPAGQPRVTIILLDLLNTGQFQRTDAKEQLLKFLSRDLRNQDSISLLCIKGKGLESILPFTSDRKALIVALQKLDTTGHTAFRDTDFGGVTTNCKRLRWRARPQDPFIYDRRASVSRSWHP